MKNHKNEERRTKKEDEERNKRKSNIRLFMNIIQL